MSEATQAQVQPDDVDFSRVRLHVVTGKGGTGKTTVAAALAIALATGGSTVLVVEVEGRQGLAQVFDIPPLPYEERRIAAAPGGGTVHALAIDPEAAMLEYLQMFWNIKRGGQALKKLGAVDFATTIAPGLRDVLLTGKTGESVRRRNGRAFVYDAVVLDAPPTGRISRFLTANHEVAELARVGPIRNQADTVMRVIRSAETAVHLVTLLEEMPVQETVDGIAELRANGLPVGALLVNMARSDLLADVPLSLQEPEQVPALLRQGLDRTGLWPSAGGAELAAHLAAELADHRARVGLEDTERARLEAAGPPVLTLPLLPDGVDSGALFGLAELLREQGVGRGR